jgi:phage terminase small subunit
MASKRVPPKKTAAKKSTKVVFKPGPVSRVKAPPPTVLSKARSEAAKPRREAFIKAMALGKSKTQAAKDAGYSPRTAHVQGNRLLKVAEIQQAVVHERNRVAQALGIDPEFVLGNIRSLAVVNMQDYEDLCSAESSAEMREALRALPREVAAAIQECEWETWFDKSEGVTKGMVRLRLYGQKLAANEQLGKHISLHGFGTSKVEMTGKDGGAIVTEHAISANLLTEAQLMRIAAGLPLEGE